MIDEILSASEEKMNNSINSFKKELSSMKAGRANPLILDRIEVEYYGSMTPLNQLSNISAPEARVLLIQPFDRTSIKNIEKAILKSDLGLNPSNDGTVIRLVIPELTEETRKDLVKKVKKAGEETKIAVRSARRDCNDKIKGLKKNSKITEDEMKKYEDKIQKATDNHIKTIDKLLESKEKEVMSI